MALVENNINNLSYTSKDFESIFPELLDLVKQLTTRWDPSTSNESDPGVVLLKLMAIMADKNDYNIDKNILEAFPGSVTQKGNARKLYNQLGYDMKWYQSATTNVSFSVSKDTLTKDSDGNDLTIQTSLDIPAFTMISTDRDGIIYTTTEKVSLTSDNLTASTPCIQGVIQKYTLNGSEVITLDNLDSNNCIYFNETQVAENGVFIKNEGNSNDSIIDWERVDNLAIQASGEKKFKFGVVPNTNTCYIQFPPDIATLIGGGLRIFYVISAGSEGNVGVNTINNFYSIDNFDLTNIDDNLSANITVAVEDIIVRNSDAGVGGADPESLSEAYNNFKKTIGTFNTLVTCRDYENYIYELKETLNNHYLVSNVKVSDRTNDLNYTTYVTKLNERGENTKELLITNSDSSNGLDNSFTPFDIRLYLLNSPYSITNDTQFNLSFTQAPASTTSTSKGEINSVVNRLEDAKSIQHEYKDFSNDDYFIVKNFCKLTGNLITYYKVTPAEVREIEERVKQALRENFYSHNVNWGEEINYDSLISVIQSADDRIKNVILNEPVYDPYILKANSYAYSGGKSNPSNLEVLIKLDTSELYEKDTNGDYTSTPTLAGNAIFEYTAKMIEEGTVPYFNFNKDFNFYYGQLAAYNEKTVGNSDTPFTGTLNSIYSISTSTAVGWSDNTYVIKPNENIYLTSPNFVDEKSYGVYVNYAFNESLNANVAGGNNPLKENIVYQLQEGEEIYLIYQNQNEIWVPETLEEGDLVKFNFDAQPNISEGQSGSNNKKIFNGQNKIFRILTASENINKVKINSVTFDSDILYCLWILNNGIPNPDKNSITYTLFAPGVTEYILKNNEYFIYTNENKDVLNILGSGTRISRSSKDSSLLVNEVSNEIVNTTSLSDILNDGVSAIGANNWKEYYKSVTGELSITDMQIITLGEGAGIKRELETTDSDDSEGNPIYKYSYKSDSTETTWTPLNNALNVIDDLTGKPVHWNLQASLNIITSPENPQKITGEQKVIVTTVKTDSEGNPELVDGNMELTNYTVKNSYLTFSQPISFAGGNINLGTLSFNNDSKYLLNAYSFVLANANASPQMIALGEMNSYNIENDIKGNSSNWNFTYKGNTPYIMYINPLSSRNITLKASGLKLFNLNDYSISQDTISNITITEPTFLCLNSSTTGNINIFNNAIFSPTLSDDSSIMLSNIYEVNGISKQLQETFGNTSLDGLNNLLQKTLGNNPNTGYNPVYQVKDVDALDTSLYGENKGIFAPTALWDPNHILNPYTLPQLDLSEEGYNIKVAASSRAGGGLN